ncbi:uncharacterized protein [Oscarella lobularis]|uniref:uncharacterized protein isoform X2 n=1 Tax=Oscarella lobularis TaxID=121494 RepID=UPI0033135062
MSIMTCPNVNVTDVTWDWNKLSAKCPFNRTNETLGLPLSRPWDAYSFSGALLFGLGAVETIVFACVLLAKYNSVIVMKRRIHIATTSSVRWILFYLLLSFRCVVYTAYNSFPPKNNETSCKITFITGNVLEALALLMLLLALYHEWKCRSTVYVTQGGFFRKKRLMVSFCEFLISPQCIFVLHCLATLLFLTVAELECFRSGTKLCPRSPGSDSDWLFWTFAGLIVSMYFFAIVTAIVRVADRKRDGPNAKSIIILFLALALNALSCFPAFLLQQVSPKLVNCIVAIDCYASPIEFIQLSAMLSWLLFFVFIRNEYLRVVQESKHAIIGDIQAMLDFDASWRTDSK